ncbi:MAG TPA: hypothetical protein PLP17_05875 [Oligoflexia bacterium]|nr:hypothetical protein [Oligoflexia bacterium]
MSQKKLDKHRYSLQKNSTVLKFLRKYRDLLLVLVCIAAVLAALNTNQKSKDQTPKPLTITLKGFKPEESPVLPNDSLTTPSGPVQPELAKPTSFAHELRSDPGNYGLIHRRGSLRKNGLLLHFLLSWNHTITQNFVAALKTELSNNKDQKIFFSLEPWDPLPPQSKRIRARLDTTEFLKGFDITLLVPASDSPIHYGLFLCAAREKDSACAGKETLSITNPRLGSAGANLFFAYLLIDGDSVYVLDYRPNTEAAYRGLYRAAEYAIIRNPALEQLSGKEKRERAKNLVRLVKQYDERLGSRGFGTAETALQIVLPCSPT